MLLWSLCRHLTIHHVDHVHTRSVDCAHGEHDLHDARTNSCLGHTCCTREFTGFAQYTREFRETY